MGVLELKNVSLTLGGKPILNDLSVDFWEGHIHALVGPNGAGKSTLASTIMGLARLHRTIDGDILLDGESHQRPAGRRARPPRHHPGLAGAGPLRGPTVDRFIARRRQRQEHGRGAPRCSSRVGLDPDKYMRRAVDRTLSGGERKRIELASILAMEPRIVLMDEPDSGIDVEALTRIFDALADFKERGATVIMITHSQEVLQHAEHAFLMCNGQRHRQGRRRQDRRLLRRPLHAVRPRRTQPDEEESRGWLM